MSNYRAGMRVRLSKDGKERGAPVVIWSEAPGTGCYWAHLDDRTVVRIRIYQPSNAPHPIVQVTEEQA